VRPFLQVENSDQFLGEPINLLQSISVFFHLSQGRIRARVCMVCMYACDHIGVHCWQDGVSLLGGNTDGNPFVWVCRLETPRVGLSRFILLPN